MTNVSYYSTSREISVGIRGRKMADSVSFLEISDVSGTFLLSYVNASLCNRQQTAIFYTSKGYFFRRLCLSRVGSSVSVVSGCLRFVQTTLLKVTLIHS